MYIESLGPHALGCRCSTSIQHNIGVHTNIVTMILTKCLLALAVAGFDVLGAPSQPSEHGIIGPRQNTWYNKEWGNDLANMTYENRAGGAFAVSWKEVSISSDETLKSEDAHTSCSLMEATSLLAKVTIRAAQCT
jgi:hypothetical protein